MTTERDRTKEVMNDPEIKAMVAVARALRHLDLGTRRRVLVWSQTRFGSDEPDPDYDFAKKLMNATEEIGRRFGNMTHLEVMMALEAIVTENQKLIQEKRDTAERTVT